MGKQKYTTQYKTFDSLMADVEEDLQALSAENYIQPDKYIKVVQTCNGRLSIKINPIKEDLITIINGVGKLPKDFKVLEMAYMCVDVKLQYSNVDTITKEYIAPPSKYKLQEIYNSCSTLTQVEDSKGAMSFVVLKRDTNSWWRVNRIVPLYISNSDTFCSNSCSRNSYSQLKVEVYREGEDVYIKSNVDGEIYISYTSEMMDDAGNLLLLDHPLVQEFYEYSVKKRIYEDAYLNGREEYLQKLQYITNELRRASVSATSFVSMVDFSELKQVYFDNRKRFKLRYDKIIQE